MSDFNNEEFNPPKELDKEIINMVHRDLESNPKILFLKVLGIQGIIGVLTLLFCPQFNFSLTNNYELFHYFHRTFGEAICMGICGAIFIGIGALIVSTFVRERDLKEIHSHPFLYFVSITGIAIFCFYLLGAEIYFMMAIYWAIGALSSALIFFELGRIIRLNVFQK